MRANHLSNKSSSLPEAVDAGAGGADAFRDVNRAASLAHGVGLVGRLGRGPDVARLHRIQGHHESALGIILSNRTRQK